MDPKIEKASPARRWWLIIGGIVLFVVIFDQVERLVRPDAAPSENNSTAAEDADAARSPPPPELRRLDDGAVEIRHDFFRRTTIRLGNEEDESVLFECLEQGIEKAFGDGTEGWSRRRVRRETERIQSECMDLPHGLPIPPPTPRPGN